MSTGGTNGDRGAAHLSRDQEQEPQLQHGSHGKAGSPCRGSCQPLHQASSIQNSPEVRQLLISPGLQPRLPGLQSMGKGGGGGGMYSGPPSAAVCPLSCLVAQTHHKHQLSLTGHHITLHLWAGFPGDCRNWWFCSWHLSP